jgi:hypothetical protein
LTRDLKIGTHAETMARLSMTEYLNWRALYQAEAKEAEAARKGR